MVVLHHAGFAVLAGGGSATGSWPRRAVVEILWRMNLGVPMFFVISGYCIGASADASARASGRSGGFLKRRFLRIYPPYWAALALFVGTIAGLDALGMGWLHQGPGALELGSPVRLSWPQWLGNLTLTETWRPRFGSPPEAIYTRVAWSLCYEEQFYFLCTLALLVFPRRLWAAFGWGSLAILTVTAVARDVGLGPSLDGTFFARWHEFAVGLAVYWRLHRARSAIPRTAIDLGLIGMFAIAGPGRGLLLRVGTHQPDAGLDASTAASAFGLILIALHRFDDRAAKAPALAPFFACGKRSYSIYLIHLLPCTIGCRLLFRAGIRDFWAEFLVTVPLISAVATAVGWVCFATVERPSRGPQAARDPARLPRESPDSGASRTDSTTTRELDDARDDPAPILVTGGP